jgi:hypothetical protein
MNINKLFLILILITSTCNAQFPDYDFLQKVTNQTKEELLNSVQWLDKQWASMTNWWTPYYPVLSNLINRFNLKIGCEIGVAYGMHSEYILKNTDVEKLYSIDPYKHFDQDYLDDPMNYPQKYHDVLFYRVLDLLSQFKERSKLLRMTSVDAAKMFTDNSLDFVFIDANHSYQGVKDDLISWYDKVRDGGILSGDDYTIDIFPGLVKAVDEFFSSKKLQVNQDSEHPRIWWVIKSN